MTTYTLTAEQMEQLRSAVNALRQMTGMMSDRGLAMKVRRMMQNLNSGPLAVQPDVETTRKKRGESTRPRYFANAEE